MDFGIKPLSARALRQQAAENSRAEVLAAHVARGGDFNVVSLAKSYALPVARVAAIIERIGGRRA